MDKNLINIQKLAKMLDGHQMVTVEDFKSAVSDFINAFAQHRSAFKELSTKNEEAINATLKNLQGEFEKVRTDVSRETGMTKEEMKTMMAKCMSDMEEMCQEVMDAKPEDGKDGMDADEERIIQEVLAKIKLPEEKPEETPNEEIDKINLATNQIKKERVEGLEQAILNSATNAVQAMPVTTMFVNGKRSKNLSITGATVSTTGDTTTVDISASGGTSIGGTVTSGTAGSVLFINPDSTLAQDNTNFKYTTATNLFQVGSGSTTSIGLVMGPTTDSGYAAIWNTSVTRSVSNYSIRFLAGATNHSVALNAGTTGDVTISINNGARTNWNNAPGSGPYTTAGTATTDVQAGSFTQTWNNSGVTFTGIKYNVTDTASNASSLLMDLQVGGTSQFKVAKAGGNITLAGSNAYINSTSGSLQLGAGASTYVFGIYSTSVALLGSTGVLGWSSGVTYNTTPDTGLSRVSAGLLAVGNGTAGDFTGKLQLTNIELGHATDTTISRVSAGVISVEGVTVPTISSTNTLTNKRFTPRVYTAANNASLTPEIDTYDIFHLTAMSAATTINNHSTSTPADGEIMEFRFLDNGTARALSWGTNYVAKAGVALPSTTVLSKNLCVIFEWNANLSKWNLLASGQEA